jgi:hypothetical protein
MLFTESMKDMYANVADGRALLLPRYSFSGDATLYRVSLLIRQVILAAASVGLFQVGSLRLCVHVRTWFRPEATAIVIMSGGCRC